MYSFPEVRLSGYSAARSQDAGCKAHRCSLVKGRGSEAAGLRLKAVQRRQKTAGGMMKQTRNVALDCAVVCLALGAVSIIGDPAGQCGGFQ